MASFEEERPGERRGRTFPDLDAVREANRARILSCIRESGIIARIEISSRTGISPATVSVITAKLLDDGLIEHTEGSPEDAAAARGRPKAFLRLNPRAVYAVGIKLSVQRVFISLTNFLGEIVVFRTRSVSLRRIAPQVLAKLCADEVAAIIAETGTPRDRLAGIGIGCPGLVDYRNGIIQWSPIFDERLIPLRNIMEEMTGLRVVIDNDVNLVGLAEQWFGLGRNLAEFVVITVEHGVGMAIVMDGRLRRGQDGFAAELGHMKIRPEGALCRCGQRGCLEAYVADYAIAREAATFFAATDLGDETAIQATIDKLSVAADNGNVTAREIFERAGTMFGIGIGNLAKLLNPPVVFLSGERTRSAAVFFEAMEKSLAAQAIVPGSGMPRVEIHRWGDELWARGAAALVLETFTSDRALYAVDPLVTPQAAE
jgi:transcriptional regulator of PTS gene